ncbi:MAG TPA: ABC transporter permease subunit [Croceibacterium sp.]|nr:ABC transporter permease subunit [Croceibacterium sp.]
MHEPRFAFHVLVTLREAFVGFVLGNALAFMAAVAMVRWRFLETSIMPYAIALKTTPVAALAPILILWLGGGWQANAAAAAAVAFFPTLVSLVRGLRLVDAPDHREFRDLFASWGVGWIKTLIYLRLPFSTPLLFSALKVSSSLALVGAMVGEFISANAGLGYLVVRYSRQLDTAHMFSAVIVSALVGVIWYYLVEAAELLFSRRMVDMGPHYITTGQQ